MFNMYNFKKVCFTLCAVATMAACAMPTAKAEARGEGTVAVAAGLGALVGAAIASDAHHKHHHRQYHRAQCHMERQQQAMNYVLMNYNPAFHDAWVRYVLVDCSYVLSPVQQEQMLHVMSQRRAELGYSVPVGMSAGR